MNIDTFVLDRSHFTFTIVNDIANILTYLEW